MDNPIKRLIESAEYKAALKTLKEENLFVFANSQPHQTDIRQIAYEDLRAIGRFEGRMIAIADNWTLEKRKV